MTRKNPKSSQLFTLRLWPNEDEEGHIQWRGKLHHINNDEIRYFHDWASLVPILWAMLKEDKSYSANIDQKDFDEL